MADVRIPTSLQDQASLSSPVRAQALPSEAVFDALQMILLGAPLNEILTSVTRLIEAHSEGMLCSISLVEEDGLHLRYAGAPNLPEAYRAATDGLRIGPNVGSCGAAAYLREPVFVSDILCHPNWASFGNVVLQSGLRAVWSTPIVSHVGKVVGTFCMYYREARHPDPSEIQLIDYASHIAAIAIERKRTEEALREKEERFLQMADALPEVIWIAALEPEKLLYVSPSFERVWGLRVADIYRSPRLWMETIHPEDRDRVASIFTRWISGEEVSYHDVEFRIIQPNGAIRWIHEGGALSLNEQGRPYRACGISTDITERKRAEDNLRQDQQELRRITELIPQAILVQDPSGVPLYANQAMLNYTGLTIEDVLAPGFRKRIFHPDDWERITDKRKASLPRGIPFEIEQRALGKDGTYRWFLIRYNPFCDEQGRVIRWYVTGTDIDDRVKAEERIRNENLALREQIDRDSMFEDIVGSSEALGRVLRQVAKVAPSDSTVLILGETGTGKELIARAIHKRSKRAQRAFIGVNCAAIPPSLIASELFGYEKGAFTGATQRRLGRFESANGGTIFLDEVGDLPHEIQIALLRVLQEREFERVGSNVPISVDVRVLAATHRDLDALVAEGKFRQDLLYRLNVVPISVPPLRERAADLPLLVEYFIARFGKKAGKKFRAIDDSTLKLFQTYGWPGNVRELQNVIERAVILSDGDTLSVDETWLKRRPSPAAAGPAVALSGALNRQEKEMIEAALAESQGRVSGPTGAAAKLGLPTRTLDSKITRLGINKYQFKIPQG